MCRSIRTLANFDPPATDDEVRRASTQFVNKIAGFSKPSRVNEMAFNRAVEALTSASQELLGSLVTRAKPRNRQVEAERARVRSAARFGRARTLRAG